jgi:ketosteroid isomerase-like protein
MLEAPAVDMKDLVVNVFGEVAVATFNGHFAGRIRGHPVERDQQRTMVLVKVRGDWKIVPEHHSPIGAPHTEGRRAPPDLENDRRASRLD